MFCCRGQIEEMTRYELPSPSKRKRVLLTGYVMLKRSRRGLGVCWGREYPPYIPKGSSLLFSKRKVDTE